MFYSLDKPKTFNFKGHKIVVARGYLNYSQVWRIGITKGKGYGDHFVFRNKKSTVPVMWGIIKRSIELSK